MQADALVAVMEALESDLGVAFEDGVFDVERRCDVDPIRPGAAQPSTLAEQSRLSGATRDSLIKARYAATVLRTALSVDRPTAARLMRGLASDLPDRAERCEIAERHLRATELFNELAVALGKTTQGSPKRLWEEATSAIEAWMRALRDAAS